jgi:hypothetical protein
MQTSDIQTFPHMHDKTEQVTCLQTERKNKKTKTNNNNNNNKTQTDRRESTKVEKTEKGDQVEKGRMKTRKEYIQQLEEEKIRKEHKTDREK